VVIGSLSRSRSGKCLYTSSDLRLGSIADAAPFSSMTGSASRVRRIERPSPMRSKKRR
jgi:hypothetical protein